MYLFKAKKNLDARDFEDYRRRLVDRDDKSYVHITGSRAGGALDEPSQSQPGPTADGQTLGMAAAGAALSQAPSSTFDTVTVACPWLQVKRGVESETTTTRPVEVCMAVIYPLTTGWAVFSSSSSCFQHSAGFY